MALLSVLDSRLTGPTASDFSSRTSAQGLESVPLMEMDGVLVDGTLGARPTATVTSAVVV